MLVFVFCALFDLSLRIVCVSLCNNLIALMKQIMCIYSKALDWAITIRNAIDKKREGQQIMHKLSFVQMFESHYSDKKSDSVEIEVLKQKIYYLSKEKIVLETLLEREFDIYRDSSRTSSLSSHSN